MPFKDIFNHPFYLLVFFLKAIDFYLSFFLNEAEIDLIAEFLLDFLELVITLIRVVKEIVLSSRKMFDKGKEESFQLLHWFQ